MDTAVSVMKLVWHSHHWTSWEMLHLTDGCDLSRHLDSLVMVCETYAAAIFTPDCAPVRSGDSLKRFGYISDHLDASLGRQRNSSIIYSSIKNVRVSTSGGPRTKDARITQSLKKKKKKKSWESNICWDFSARSTKERFKPPISCVLDNRFTWRGTTKDTNAATA